MDAGGQGQRYASSDAGGGESLEALQKAVPSPILFDELDFNFGERWIPTGIYEAYMSYLYDTDIKIAYVDSVDEFTVSCDRKNMKIYEQFAVKGYYKRYDGMNLLKHALHNTVPDIYKSIGKDDKDNDIKVRDSEALRLYGVAGGAVSGIQAAACGYV